MDELTGRTARGTVGLSLASLFALSDAVSRPSYRRASLSAGIVHIGVGNFHRAHMAAYLDDLLEQGRAHDWAIVGAGVTTADAAMRERLMAQDWLTTVIEQDGETARARVTGAMIGFIDPADRAALVARMSEPAIRIVSLTLTEGGYFIDPATGRFDSAHPAIRRDALNPGMPETAFGLMLAALSRRRAAGVPPFAVMSCDNIPHNGDATRRTLVGLAALADPELAALIERGVGFPNGMVDRITPATGEREKALAVDVFGVRSAARPSRWRASRSFRMWRRGRR
jgi:mannitol 2-dehydrogenase